MNFLNLETSDSVMLNFKIKKNVIFGMVRMRAYDLYSEAKYDHDMALGSTIYQSSLIDSDLRQFKNDRILR